MIETERLILRHWHEDDAEALYKYASDGRVSELALWPRHTSVMMSRQVIAEYFSPNPHCFAMVLKETGEPVGCIGLVPPGEEHHPVAHAEYEIGYWIGYPYWGQGMTTEALAAIVGYCRSCLQLKSVLITTDSRNIASQRVAEKCGFRFMENYEFDGLASKAFRLNLLTHNLEIKHIHNNKTEFMDLLLTGDESEEMVCRYLKEGSLYVGFYNGTAVAVTVTTENDDNSVEINNLAVATLYRRHGIGRRMLEYVEQLHPGRTFRLGTGETPSTLRFYRSCGYRFSHRVPDFFTDNYPTPIVEEGVRLEDMIYLLKDSVFPD